MMHHGSSKDHPLLFCRRVSAESQKRVNDRFFWCVCGSAPTGTCFECILSLLCMLLTACDQKLGQKHHVLLPSCFSRVVFHVDAPLERLTTHSLTGQNSSSEKMSQVSHPCFDSTRTSRIIQWIVTIAVACTHGQHIRQDVHCEASRMDHLTPLRETGQDRLSPCLNFVSV
jgi:hypothetical protein